MRKLMTMGVLAALTLMEQAGEVSTNTTGGGAGLPPKDAKIEGEVKEKVEDKKAEEKKAATQPSKPAAPPESAAKKKDREKKEAAAAKQKEAEAAAQAARIANEDARRKAEEALAAAAEAEGRVAVNVPRSYGLNLGNGVMVQITQGQPTMPREHAEHAYSKANGVTIVGLPSTK